MRRTCALLTAIGVTSFADGGRVRAQATPPAFEVASVKPAAPNNRTRMQFLAGGRFTATSMTLKTLLSVAYDIREFQISGGPDWMTSARFDVSSKAEHPSATTSDMVLMLRTMLADRFKLALHWETRDVQVYELVVADSGLKLRESDASKARSLDGGGGRAIGAKVTMDLLSQFLSMQLGRTVVDKTGVNGAYDVTLTWTPETNPVQNSADNPRPLDGPSIFTAVQEQLGLKLVSRRGPVEWMMVDRAERPAAN